MARDTNTTIWYTSRPKAWPDPPSLMSFSTLCVLETCPRRWALSSASYPEIWSQAGYPRTLSLAAIEGTAVHMALEILSKAMSDNGCPSVADGSAVKVLKELGGYTVLLERCVENALQAYSGNPRALPALERTRRLLAARIPDLRTKVQSLLSRVRLESRNVIDSSVDIGQHEHKKRTVLSYGSYAEVELRAPDISWHGYADILTLSATHCEIRDFKTGTPKDEHQFQLIIYALLWWRDRDLNPSARLANRLVVSYDDRDIEIEASGVDVLCSAEEELRKRTTAALATLKHKPPEARPSSQNCSYCNVRHLCEEYWEHHVESRRGDDTSEEQCTDLQIRLSARHGPSSWEVVVESSSSLKTGRSILLRTSNLLFELHPGQRLRLLNIRLSVPREDPLKDECSPVIATIGKGTEIFQIFT